MTVELYPFVDDPDGAARRALSVLRPLVDAGRGRPDRDPMAIKPYLQLVRLPNVFTAAADSLAGWLLVQGTFGEPGRWLPLVLASVAIYAGGIVLNDVFDYEVDRVERPERPLPSGRVSRRFAAGLGGILLAARPGPGGASSGSTDGWAVASALIGVRAGLRRGPEADACSAPR